MKILLSNDDGVRAEGLDCLAQHLREIADLVIVAPDRNRSGASNSLTLDGPLRVQTLRPGVHAVNGTPTDCVHLAVTGLLDDEPDLVVSGINHGANLGDDVIYSGTVAAAMEGRFLGLPAIAISLASEGEGHFETAGRIARDLIRDLDRGGLSTSTILNVNVPDLPYDAIEGVVATRLGYRHRAEPVQRVKDPRGRTCYWIGAAGPEADAGPGTDFHAVASARVSVTPLHVDLTHHAQLDTVASWLGHADE